MLLDWTIPGLKLHSGVHFLITDGTIRHVAPLKELEPLFLGMETPKRNVGWLQEQHSWCTGLVFGQHFAAPPAI
jgi:hypothetical protein